MTTGPPTYDSVSLTAASGAGDVLPEYDAAGAPAYLPSSAKLNHNLPPMFRIGQKYIQPLIQPSDLQAHLILLGAFHRLREEVRTQKGQSDHRLEQDDLWAVFLERAVHRFRCWATRMIADEVADGTQGQHEERRLSPDECPPLDVAMVWHTYMLSPRTYYEDCLRLVKIGVNRLQTPHQVFGVTRSHAAARSFPLLQICSTIDKETLLPHTPTESRSNAFKSFTGESFDPPTRTALEDKVTVYCPNCSTALVIRWVSSSGNGYAQRAFSAACNVRDGCQMKFNRESLGVRKFYEDMEKATLDPDKHFLANTLVDYETGIPMSDLAKDLTRIIIKPRTGSAHQLQRPEVLGQTRGWEMKDVEKLCREGFLANRDRVYLQTPRPLNIVLAPYRHAGPFSTDLASGVIRQMSFIEKIVNLGWTEEGRFEDDTDTLTRCVVRYHAFLDLMASTPGKFVVPTLDIDLGWHTHQLLCTSYRQLYDIMGTIPNHDDKVTQGAISTAYDETAAAWKARFSVPYSVCGCPPPIKSNPAGAVISVFSRKGKGRAVPTTPSNPRPDLLSSDDSNADETHPSDHNSVALMNPQEPNAAQAQARRREIGRRAKEFGRAADKNKEGDWSEVISKRTADHSYAFLSPVSYGTKDPFGNYGHGDCVVYSGSGVKGEFAAGQCAQGNGFHGQCGAHFGVKRSGLQESIHHSVIMSGDRALMEQYGIMYSTMAYGFGAGTYGSCGGGGVSGGVGCGGGGGGCGGGGGGCGGG